MRGGEPMGAGLSPPLSPPLSRATARLAAASPPVSAAAAAAVPEAVPVPWRGPGRRGHGWLTGRDARGGEAMGAGFSPPLLPPLSGATARPAAASPPVSAAAAVAVAAAAVAVAAVAVPRRGHGRHGHGSKTGPAAGGRGGEGGGLGAAAVAAAVGRDRDRAGAVGRGRVIGLWAPEQNVKDEAEVGLCQPLCFLEGRGQRQDTRKKKIRRDNHVGHAGHHCDSNSSPLLSPTMSSPALEYMCSTRAF